MKDAQKPGDWLDTPVFADFKEKEIKKVLKLGMLEWQAEGTPVFLRGDIGEEMFLVADGSVRIHDYVDGEDIQIATLGPGEIFGEMAALSQQPRSAHATTATDSMLLTFTEKKFEEFLEKESKISAKLMTNMFRIAALRLLDHLKQAQNRMSTRLSPMTSDEMPKLFAGIKTDLKKKILEGGEIKVYKRGQVLFKRGELGDRLYVIMRGEVHIIVPKPPPEGNEIVSILEEGGMLGEVGLVTGGKRTAAAMAVKPTQTLELSTEGLDRLLRRQPKAATRLLLNLFRITAARLRAATDLAMS